MTIETLQFTPDDQRRFASLSGDFNPLHVDPVAARRRAAGEPVVHGMHLLLRALEAFFRRSPRSHVFSISATFQRPALPRDRIQVSQRDGRLTLTLDETSTLAEIELSSATRTGSSAFAVRPPAARQSAKPCVLAFDELTGASGTVAPTRSSAAARAFPHTSKALGGHVVAALAGLSRIVGMECPGRDSLLSAIDVAVTPHAPSSHLSWRVATTDRRFRRVRLEVGGSCLHGTVDAFVTQPPSPLPTFDSVTALIGRDEFAGQRALIVGGSRGLGAATAVIVASGGGVPLVTFATGSEEAALLRGNARRAARHIETLRFDVVADPMDRLQRASRKFGPTHLYYFASPRIFVRRRGLFDAALFERFSAFYVSGFAGACAAARGRSPLTAFYPSSTALDEPVRELTEYLAAKAAGEALCRSMAETMPDVRIVVRRMGRVVTDQTASLVATRAVEPVAAMLPIVREIHRMSGEKT